MKTLTAVTALILSVLFICGAKAPDTPVYEYKVDGIYIHDITVAELEDFYRIYGLATSAQLKTRKNATSSSCKSSALWL